MPETVSTAPPKKAAPRSAWTTETRPTPNGKSRTELSYQDFLTYPFDDQRKEVDQKWLELAFVLPTRALRLALTATKKEMGQLQQIVTAAAIAKDKRFPHSEEAFTIRLPASLLQAYSVAIQVAPIPAGVSTQIVQAEAQAVPKDIV